jgi:hypothetical protein
MFAKSTFVLGFALATASGVLAATKPLSAQLSHDAYDARGSAGHTRSAPGVAVGRKQIRLDDCIHVAFPQCDGKASQSEWIGLEVALRAAATWDRRR